MLEKLWWIKVLKPNWYSFTYRGICYKNSGLSNHPGKLESIFFCYAAMCFPNVGMFSFLHRECLNLRKGRDKMYLNSILEKGAFLC